MVDSGEKGNRVEKKEKKDVVPCVREKEGRKDTALDSSDPTAVLSLARELEAHICIKDRYYRFKRYENCFLGTEAFTFLVHMLRVRKCDDGGKREALEDEAIRFGNEMIARGIFQHVKGKHTFQNKYLFYRFLKFGPHRLKSKMVVTQDVTTTLTTEEKNMRPEKDIPSSGTGDVPLDSSRGRSSSEIANMSSISVFMYICALSVYVLFIVPFFDTYQHYTTLKFVFDSAARVVAIGALLLIAGPIPCDRRCRRRGRIRRSDDSSGGIATQEGLHAFSTKIVEKERNATTTAALSPSAPSTLESQRKHGQHSLSFVVMSASSSPLPVARFNDFVPFPIETDLFRGVIMILARNAPSAYPSRIEHYFRGKKRVTAVFVQGRFKRTVSFDRVLTGQTFGRPLKHLPGRWILDIALTFLRSIAPVLRIDLFSKTPYILTPLASAAQTIHVSDARGPPPPDLTDWSLLREDNRLENLGIKWKRVSRSRAYRRKYFQNIENLEAHAYNVNCVYTFGFWQNLFDPHTYTCKVPFGNFDVSSYLDGQPLQITAITTDSGGGTKAKDENEEEKRRGVERGRGKKGDGSGVLRTGGGRDKIRADAPALWRVEMRNCKLKRGA